MQVIRLGLVGAGYMANEYLKVLKNNKKFSIEGISSRSIKSSSKLAKIYNIERCFDDHKTMVKELNLDAIVVTVSIENTYKITRDLLKKNIPVMIEKPISLHYKKALVLSKLALKFNVKTMVALNRRHYSNLIKVKSILKSKKEQITNIIIEGHERFWRVSGSRSPIVENRWLFANSIHTIDLLNFFCGDIKKYNLIKKRQIIKNSNNFQISIEFKNGALGSYISNWDIPGGWTMKIYSKSYCFNFHNLENCTYNDRSFIKKSISLNKYDLKYKPGLHNMINSFYEYLIYDIKNESSQTISDNVKIMKFINEIYEQKAKK